MVIKTIVALVLFAVKNDRCRNLMGNTKMRGAYNLQISHDAKKINKKSGNSKTSGVQNRLAHRQSEFETVNSKLRQKIQVRG